MSGPRYRKRYIKIIERGRRGALSISQQCPHAAARWVGARSMRALGCKGYAKL